MSRSVVFLRKLSRCGPGLVILPIAWALSGCGNGRVGEMAGPPEATWVVPSDAVQWDAAPPAVEEGAQIAVLEGDPDEAGPFTVRLRMPDGYIIAPHTHPHFERVTVLEGTLHLGLSEQFDPDVADALPAGSFFYLPPEAPHFVVAEGETIIQVSAEGPFDLTYLNSDTR